MNEHEIDRIASAFHVLRPDWPHTSLRTFIAKNLATRPRRDVCVALAWVACESNTATPARVLEAGPWWKAAAIEGSGPTAPHTGRTVGRDADPREVCGICDMWRADCERRKATSGHDFVPRIDCLPPTSLGALGERGTCLAGPIDSPCQLITGHEGAHHCLPPKAATPPTVAYLEARRNRPATDEPEPA